MLHYITLHNIISSARIFLHQSGEVCLILLLYFISVTKGSHRKDKDKGRVLQRPKDIKYNIRMSLLHVFHSEQTLQTPSYTLNL